jgi:hypothetical protein
MREPHVPLRPARGSCSRGRRPWVDPHDQRVRAQPDREGSLSSSSAPERRSRFGEESIPSSSKNVRLRWGPGELAARVLRVRTLRSWRRRP